MTDPLRAAAEAVLRSVYAAATGVSGGPDPKPEAFTTYVSGAALEALRAALAADTARPVAWPLTREGESQLRAIAEAAIERQVHPANWSYWVRMVLMAGPARDFVEMVSPTLVLAMLSARPDATRLAAAINDAQIDPSELRLGRDLLPVAERILAALGEASGG